MPSPASEETVQPPPLRADALRNREKLLAAAVEEFNRAGSESSLEEIARQAGVGIGTLYRHFPTRDALILAAFRLDVEELRDRADALLADLPPDRALREWLVRLAALGRTKHWMADALNRVTKTGTPPRSESYRAIVGALDRLLAASVDAGAIRADISADDLMLAVAGLWHIDTSDDWRTQTGRVIDLLMDGLYTKA